MKDWVPLPFESRDASTLSGVATDGVTGTAGRSVAVSAPTTRSLRKIMLLAVSTAAVARTWAACKASVSDARPDAGRRQRRGDVTDHRSAPRTARAASVAVGVEALARLAAELALALEIHEPLRRAHPVLGEGVV